MKILTSAAMVIILLNLFPQVDYQQVSPESKPMSNRENKTPIEFHFFYTIQVEHRAEGKILGRVVGQFDDSALSNFWRDLGVSQQQWSEWSESLSSGRWFIVLPDLPQISSLAAVDEGRISYAESDLQSLHDECLRAKETLQSEPAQKLLKKLLKATDLALQGHGAVVVHPFLGGSQVDPDPA